MKNNSIISNRKSTAILGIIAVCSIIVIATGSGLDNPSGMFSGPTQNNQVDYKLVIKNEVYGEMQTNGKCKVIDKTIFDSDYYVKEFTDQARMLEERFYSGNEEEIRTYSYSGDPWDLSSNLLAYYDSSGYITILETENGLPSLEYHEAKIIESDQEDKVEPIKFFTAIKYIEIDEYTIIEVYKGFSKDEAIQNKVIGKEPTSVYIVLTEDMGMNEESYYFPCDTHILTEKTFDGFENTITKITTDKTYNVDIVHGVRRHYDNYLNVYKTEYWTDIGNDGVIDDEHIEYTEGVDGNHGKHISSIKHINGLEFKFNYDFGQYWDSLMTVERIDGNKVDVVTDGISYNTLPLSQAASYFLKK